MTRIIRLLVALFAVLLPLGASSGFAQVTAQVPNPNADSELDRCYSDKPECRRYSDSAVHRHRGLQRWQPR